MSATVLRRDATAPLLLDEHASVLAFQRRVLEEAQDEGNPLLERVKFLAILFDNLQDFMTRADRVRPEHALAAADALLRDGTEYLHRRLVPRLAAQGIRIVDDDDLWRVAKLDRPALRDVPITSRIVPSLLQPNLFAAIARADVLLHHPFDSFEPVVNLFQDAAADRDVRRIAVTLYRTDVDSPIFGALVEAALRGVEVTAVVEPNARRDEANNAAWARELTAAGARVIHGAGGLKVHAKLAMITRREGAGERRYVHISSGNYHTGTARTYTDLALLTCDDDVADDVSGLFDMLNGDAVLRFRTLAVAPLTLRGQLETLLEREIACAQRGEPAHAILKMNALSDPAMIALLCLASRAGVRLDLIVRGLCRLRPGVRGLSERIRVRSVVGRFLEHSRAWYFENGGRSEAYVGSADLMPRNFDERVEVMVPIRCATGRRRLRNQILAAYLADNVKARELTSHGTYARAIRSMNTPAVSSQHALITRM
jgi:polyphosphate kinase